MLQILLTILKIIGIILLVILGLLLLVLLSVLLVPIRYQGAGAFHETPEGRIKVSWLLHILAVQARYKERLELAVRVFGIRVFHKTLGNDEAAEEAEELFSDAADAADGTITELTADAAEDLQMSVQEVSKTDPDGKAIAAGQLESGAEPESAGRNSESASDEPTFLQKIFRPVKEKIKALCRKIKERILAVIGGIKEKFRMIRGKLRDGKALYDKAMEFLTDEANKKTLNLLRRQIFKILRHLCPRRLKGDITFGLEDPYTMGQVASAAAFLYPILKERVKFTPVFGEKVMDGELALKGRIRIGTLLCLAGRMLLDKNFRMILKKILSRGGK